MVGQLRNDKSVLLLNLPGMEHAVSSVSVNLGIASLAAVLRSLDVHVAVLDLNLYSDYESKLTSTVENLKPDVVGFGFCTPQWPIARDISNFVRNISATTSIVCGGPHASFLAEEVIEGSSIDIVAVGESELTLPDVVRCAPDCLDKVAGIYYRTGGEIKRTPTRTRLRSLDDLPFPALDMFEAEKYIYPLQSSRTNPVCLIETSRGCPGSCTFCSRVIVGRLCRFKSPKRVVDEMAWVQEVGFKEIHLADDNFTTDIQRAIEICEMLEERRMNSPWVPRSGIRVDYVDERLLIKMRNTGCYHLPFGIESTSSAVLEACNKGVNVHNMRNAILMAKRCGFEVTAYFMVGLPEQSADHIRRDIDFAANLGIDFVKFGAAIPYPGTSWHTKWQRDGLIKSRDWSRYHYGHSPFDIYEHPLLTFNDIEEIQIGRHSLAEVLNLVLDKDFEPIMFPERTINGD